MTTEIMANVEAEQALIGCLIVDRDAYFDVSAYLKPDYFYLGKHQQLYKAIGSLAAANVTVDAITLAEVMATRHNMTEQQAQAEIIPFITAAPFGLHASHYARIVEAKALRRILNHTAGKISALSHDESKPIGEVLEAAERALFSASDGYGIKDVTTIRDALMELYDATLERRERGGGMVGIPTGFIDLDRVLDGLQPDKLITMAARPGMGKSALANNIAANVAKQGRAVAIFNLEMATEEIMQRFAASEAGLPLTSIRRGDLNDKQWSLFGEATGRMSSWRTFIDDTPGLRPSQLRAKCRRIHAEHGLSLVVVDYLGLMEGDGKYQNQTALVSYISRELKKLAKELHTTVLAISQLNRSVESRADKHPQLSDLRDSGSVEQDSDTVMFIYRDQYYNPDTTERPNVAEVEIAKNRAGPTATIDLYWNGALTAFRNLQRNELRL